MTSQTPASFASHYSSDQYDAYLVAHKALSSNFKNEMLVKAWMEQSSVLQDAVFAFMHDMAERGQLETVPFSDRRRLSWPDAWNRMVKQEKPGPFDESRLKEPMGMTLSTLAEQSADYASFVKNMESCRVQGSSGDCNLTAERLFVIMKAWKPALFRLEKIAGQSTFTPVTEEAPILGVQHVEIPMPSGELLLANWFFIDAFNKTVDADKAGRPSISTEAGQHALSIEYATKHGFMSVESGNSSPDVYRQDNRIIIGSEHWEPAPGDPEPQGKKIGAICTDLRWVTAIDREVLTAIVEKIDGRESAEKQVAEFIANTTHKVITVQLPPGEPLHVHFKSDRSLGKRFDTDGATLEGFDTVFAVISPEEMNWSPVAKKTTGPKP